MARFLYTVLLVLAAPLVVLRLFWRARREPGYGERLGERFGFYGRPRDLPQGEDAPNTNAARKPSPLEGKAAEVGRPAIWIHAVSVGETRAAQPLIEALAARHPEYSIVLTHMTPTGRTTGRALFGDRVVQAWCPYDYPFAIAAFLRHFHVRLALFMETELWPNCVAVCRKQGVALWLVNARLSERSARRYQRAGWLVRPMLAQLTGIAAQTESDRARFLALGARDVFVTGNLKFDVEPPAEAQQTAALLLARIGARPVVLAASTREGEEAALLDAFLASREAARSPEVLLLIVPRHPQRFDEVAALLASRGIPFQRRSDEEPVAPTTRVLLGDSMGEMFAYYGVAQVAIMGGSLLPFGGQNLIEACAMGVPVVLGPHTFNFAQAAEDALAEGAALRVGNAHEAVAAAFGLLSDDARRQAQASAARRFAARHRGATERTLALLPLPLRD